VVTGRCDIVSIGSHINLALVFNTKTI
jgi:hypothetical protein